jgi:hypothetical protein
MQNITMITISGDMFLFDNDLTQEGCLSLQSLANSDVFKHRISSEDNQITISCFISLAKQNLGIILNPVQITFVVRIK